MKTFMITYGKQKDVSGYVLAESHDQVKQKMFDIGWPIMSLIVEVPVMQLSELDDQLRRLKSLDSVDELNS